MNDLIKKFFTSDLTEAEEKALAEQLASSEGAAERFAESAEKAYFTLGLPEPRMVGRLARFFHSAWGKWMPVIVVMGGVTAWYLWTRPVVPSVLHAVTPARVEPAPHAVGAFVTKAPVSVKPIAPKPVGTPPTPAGFGETPPNPGFVTDYRKLKVIVDQEKAGPITVSILSPEGFEVRRLYEGPLGVGKWAFSWDGIMADGMAAEPGVYHIQVTGAAKMISKEVIVR